MPSLSELGRAFLEDERQKQEQKNANALSKMRMESLTREAQAAESEARGAQKITETIDPLVNLWQAQAAEMQRDTAEANRRALLTSQLATTALEEESLRGPGKGATMSDVFGDYKNLRRIELLEGLQEGRYPNEWEMQYFLPGVTHPGAEARKMATKEFEKEETDVRQTRRSVVASWNTEMDALAKMVRESYMDPGLIEVQRQAISKRYIETLENMGIQAPQVMYDRAQMVREIPGMEKPAALTRKREGGRLPPKEGRQVYPGRRDITYGKERGAKYERMPAEQEQASVREAYAGAVREVFGGISDADVNQLVDEIMKGQTVKQFGREPRWPPEWTRREKQLAERTVGNIKGKVAALARASKKQ